MNSEENFRNSQWTVYTVTDVQIAQLWLCQI